MSDLVASGLRRVWSMKGASWEGDGPETDSSFGRKSLKRKMVSSIFSESSIECSVLDDSDRQERVQKVF